MKQSTKIWLLAGIMVLASFFRLYHITTTPPGLYPDEAMDGNNALEVAQTGHFQTFYIEDNGREGLYVNMLVFFIEALGNKPWVVRLPAAIAGIATVLGMYFLVAELFAVESRKSKVENANGPNAQSKTFGLWTLDFGLPRGEVIALVASFLLATSFWHINFSRIGFRAILAPLCLIWALYFFLKAVKPGVERRKQNVERDGSENSKKNIPCYFLRSTFYVIAAGIFFGLGFYTYIAYRIMPLLLLLFIPFFKKYPGFWKKTVLFVMVTVIIAAPIGIYFLQHPADFFGRTSEIAVTNGANPVGNFAMNLAKTALMFNFRGDSNWRHNVSGAPELWWPVGILFIIGILWSVWSLWKWRRTRRKENVESRKDDSAVLRSTFPVLLLFSWLVLAALPAAASNDGIPHALRSILMLPPAIILAAMGGVFLYQASRIKFQGVKAKNIINAIAVIFIVSVAAYAYFDYFVVWAQNPNVPGSFNADYVAIGEQMNALPSSTPKYVVVNAGGVLARGIPVPAETVMFVTDSFTTRAQIANHITYLLPDQADQIPPGTPTSTIFQIN